VGLLAGYFITGIIKTKAQLDAYSRQMGSYYAGNPPQIGDPMYRLDPSTAAAGFETYATNVIIGHGAPKYFGGMKHHLSVAIHTTFTDLLLVMGGSKMGIKVWQPASRIFSNHYFFKSH
jgi:hypothetical protein